MVDSYSRGLDIDKPIANSDETEIIKIGNLTRFHFSDKNIFYSAINLGILPHGSNIPNGIRVSVEWAMENNKACLVVCTSTLAQGVNLPIKYLVISSTFQAGQEISTRDFHNLIGRAGRSGYHTEGSVIFANPNIWDQKSTYRDSWRWDRALHLLDPSNSEECLSSLKSLIDPFTTEYIDETGAFIKIDVINFISAPSGYSNECRKFLLEKGKDPQPLLLEMGQKQKVIQALESYMMSYLKDNPFSNNEYFFAQLTTETLAYHLSTEAEKLLLLEAFRLIYKSLQRVDTAKFSYYGKALLGLDDLESIEAWLEINVEDVSIQKTNTQLFFVIWPLLIQLSSNKYLNKLKPEDRIFDASCMWLEGQTYYEIFNFFRANKVIYQAGSQNRKVTMDQVVEFTDNFLGYEMVLIVGAISDICEGKYQDPSLVESLQYLQNSLKLGLTRKIEFWLYSKGFVDREVCKLIANKLKDDGCDLNYFDNTTFREFESSFSEVLIELPSYYLGVFSEYNRVNSN